MTKKILVTGADGFIGRHIVRKLKEEGHTLNLMTHSAPSTTLKEMMGAEDQVVSGGLGETLQSGAMFRDVNLAIHLAAYTNVQAAIFKPSLDFEVSKQIVPLLDHMNEYKIPHLLNFSAGRVYGNPQKVPVTEEHSLEPAEPYGVGKLTGEIWAKTYEKIGIKTTNLRLFSVYGPGQIAKPNSLTGAVAIFARKLLENESVTIYGDGTLQRNFLQVEDLAFMIVKLVERNQWGETFNIASDRQISMKGLIDALGETIGVKPNITYGTSAPGDIDCVPSIEKLKTVLPDIKFTSLEQGLENYVAWLRTEGGTT